MKQYNLFLCLSVALCKFTSAAPTTDEGALLLSSAEHPSLDARQVSTTDCRRGLGCSYDQIEAQPLEWRISYLRNIQVGFLVYYNSNTKCKAIEGNIAFMLEAQLGSPDTWLSGVNAGLIEAIQNAVANLIGFHNRDGGNPGTKYWATYFRKVRAGEYGNDRNKHDSDWSTSEEVSSEYGRQLSTLNGYKPTPREANCYKTTQVHRFIMRNKDTASNLFASALNAGDLVNGLLGGVFDSVSALVTGLLNWVTDVTNAKSGYSFHRACTSFLNTAGSTNLSISAVIQGMLPSLLSFFRS